MKRSIYIAIIALVFSLNAYADEQISDAKKALISILLEQTGQSSAAIGTQFANLFIAQMSAMLKQTNPELDQRAFDIVEQEVSDIIQEEVVVKGAFSEMMYPIYNKHFSESELQDMIEINKTPLGKKIIKVMPLLTQEGMQAGQQFGSSLAPKIQERIGARFEAEGIK